MNISVEKNPCAFFRNGLVHIALPKGVDISFPIEGNERLAAGTDAQLNNIEIYDGGLHWPDLDEDLSFEGILNGDYGQYVRARQLV